MKSLLLFIIGLCYIQTYYTECLNCDTYLNFEYRRHSVLLKSLQILSWLGHEITFFFFIFQLKVGSRCSLKGSFSVSSSADVLERLL